ncbi:MAG: pilus assembly protein [Planctomycetes bacterium]|nr:pilus assembly protein [Planctomycetota bacterium]
MGRRGGQSIVELALVMLVLYVLLAATIELGRATFGAQALQDVARVAARELALEPLPAEVSLSFLLDPASAEAPVSDPDAARVQQRIYDRRHLVLDLSGDVNGNGVDDGQELDVVFAGLPVVNRLLRPLMIFETLKDDRRVLRYPGALVDDAFSPTGLSVRIPRVTRDADGVETIEWVDVLEPLDPDPFPLDQGGLVALRLNYPFQAAAMVGYRTDPSAPFEPNLGAPLPADDEDVVEVGPPQPLAGLSGDVGPYAGPYGLGVQLAHGAAVRPFRRLISAQAAFRREVFR